MRSQIAALSMLCACAPPSEEGPAPAVNPFGEAARCAPMVDGTVNLDVQGLNRKLEVRLPADPVGAPVVFAWHWLGGNAFGTLRYMGLGQLTDHGYIVVAPQSTGLPVEWNLTDTTDNNVDLQLFDAVLPCLWDEYEVDDARIYATGMSAGGLMTTWLTMHRADVLAATAPFSGGAFASSYTTPERNIPVMMTWGGPSDTYGTYNFDDATLSFLDFLEVDGHFTVACNHGGGHEPPAETVDMVVQFFGDHAGGDVSAWEGGLPDALPAWCR